MHHSIAYHSETATFCFTCFVVVSCFLLEEARLVRAPPIVFLSLFHSPASSYLNGINFTNSTDGIDFVYLVCTCRAQKQCTGLRFPSDPTGIHTYLFLAVFFLLFFPPPLNSLQFPIFFSTSYSTSGDHSVKQDQISL